METSKSTANHVKAPGKAGSCILITHPSALIPEMVPVRRFAPGRHDFLVRRKPPIIEMTPQKMASLMPVSTSSLRVRPNRSKVNVAAL